MEIASLSSRALAWLYSVPRDRTEGEGRSLDRAAKRGVFCNDFQAGCMLERKDIFKKADITTGSWKPERCRRTGGQIYLLRLVEGEGAVRHGGVQVGRPHRKQEVLTPEAASRFLARPHLHYLLSSTSSFNFMMIQLQTETHSNLEIIRLA